MKSESATDLRRIYYCMVSTMGSLEGIGRPIDGCADLFVHLVAELFDSTTRRDWEDELRGTTDPPTYVVLQKFMERKLHTLDALSRGKLENFTVKSESSLRIHHAKSSDDLRNRCPLCPERYYILFCSKFKSKTANDRKDIIKKYSLCLNCLGRHSVNACKSTKTCSRCSGKHHTLVHDACEQAEINQQVNVSCSTSVSQASVTSFVILLATARVKVDRFGRYHYARALIDPGSEMSLMSESLAQRLRVPRISTSVAIVGVGGQQSGHARGQVRIHVASRFGASFVDIEVLILPRLTSYGEKLSVAAQA